MKKASFLKILFILFLSFLTVKAQVESSPKISDALIFLQNQNFEAAFNSFQLILKNEPDNSQARLGLAIALIGLEKFPEASREIAKLLAHSPKDANLLEMAAQSFWRQKRYAEAEIVLKRRIGLGGETSANWALYGDVLDAQKKTGEAVSAYENAVRLAPDSIDLRYALGSLYWKTIRYDDAEREFLEILRRKPDAPRASFNLGDIYLSTGKPDKAIPLLETAAKAFPNEFDTHFALGRAFLAANKYEKAIDELQVAVKLRPQIAEGFYQLGLALRRVGRNEEAKAAFKKTQELQNAKRESENLPQIN